MNRSNVLIGSGVLVGLGTLAYFLYKRGSGDSASAATPKQRLVQMAKQQPQTLLRAARAIRSA